MKTFNKLRVATAALIALFSATTGVFAQAEYTITGGPVNFWGYWKNISVPNGYSDLVAAQGKSLSTVMDEIRKDANGTSCIVYFGSSPWCWNNGLSLSYSGTTPITIDGALSPAFKPTLRGTLNATSSLGNSFVVIKNNAQVTLDGVTITAALNGAVISTEPIAGALGVIEFSNSSTALTVQNASVIRATGSSSGNNGCAVYALGNTAAALNFTGSTLESVGGHAIAVPASCSSPVTVNNCTVTGYDRGVSAFGTSLTITGGSKAVISADMGAAIFYYNQGGSLTINGSAGISVAGGPGGAEAIHCSGANTLSVTGGTYTTSAGKQSFAVAVSSISGAAQNVAVTISGATIQHQGSGAGIYYAPELTGTITLEGSPILSAPSTAIQCFGGSVKLKGIPEVTGNIKVMPGKLSVEQPFIPGARVYTVAFFLPTDVPAGPGYAHGQVVAKDALAFLGSNTFRCADTGFTVVAGSGSDANHLVLNQVIPVYTISASSASLDFGTLQYGYTQPAPVTVTVTNTGNQTITLNQPASANYAIGTLSATTLAPGTIATFTITPKANLAAGTYNETITISGSNGASTPISPMFTVYSLPNGGQNFWWVESDGYMYHYNSSGAKDGWRLKITLSGNAVTILAGGDSLANTAPSGSGLYLPLVDPIYPIGANASTVTSLKLVRIDDAVGGISGKGPFQKDNPADSIDARVTLMALPSYLAYLGDYCFNNFKTLYFVVAGAGSTIPTDVTYIGDHAFGEWNAYNQAVSVPSGVTTIKPYAFVNWTNFNAAFTFAGNTLTTLGEGALSGWENFNQSFTLPAGLTTIGGGAFGKWEKFNAHVFAIPSSVTSIGGAAFTGWLVYNKHFVIPANVVTGEAGWFALDSNLKYVLFEGTKPASFSFPYTGTALGGTFATFVLRNKGWAATNGVDIATGNGIYDENPIRYTDVMVSFNPNGGAVAGTAPVYPVNPAYALVTTGSSAVNYPTLPTAQLSGYSFSGWTNSAGNVITAGSALTASADHTLYAQYTGNLQKLLVIYRDADAGNKEVYTNIVTGASGTAYNVNASEFSPNYVVAAQNASGTFDSNDSVDQTVYFSATQKKTTLPTNLTQTRTIEHTGAGAANPGTDTSSIVWGGSTNWVTGVVTWTYVSGSIPSYPVPDVPGYDRSQTTVPAASQAQTTVKPASYLVTIVYSPKGNIAVTYNLNDGVSAPVTGQKSVTFNAPYGYLMAPNWVATTEPYTFAGWFLAGKRITASSTVETPSAHTLIAAWLRFYSPVSGGDPDIHIGDYIPGGQTPGVTNGAPIQVTILLEDSTTTNATGRLVYDGANPSGDDGLGPYKIILDGPLPDGDHTIVTITVNPGGQTPLVIDVNEPFTVQGTITVTYDPCDGATAPTPVGNQTYGKSYKLPGSDPSWAGHAFMGWFYSGKHVTASTPLWTASDHTVGAGWFRLNTPVDTNPEEGGIEVGTIIPPPGGMPGITNGAPVDITVDLGGGAAKKIKGRLKGNPDGTFTVVVDPKDWDPTIPEDQDKDVTIVVNPGGGDDEYEIPGRTQFENKPKLTQAAKLFTEVWKQYAGHYTPKRGTAIAPGTPVTISFLIGGSVQDSYLGELLPDGTVMLVGPVDENWAGVPGLDMQVTIGGYPFSAKPVEVATLGDGSNDGGNGDGDGNGNGFDANEPLWEGDTVIGVATLDAGAGITNGAPVEAEFFDGLGNSLGTITGHIDGDGNVVLDSGIPANWAGPDRAIVIKVNPPDKKAVYLRDENVTIKVKQPSSWSPATSPYFYVSYGNDNCNEYNGPMVLATYTPPQPAPSGWGSNWKVNPPEVKLLSQTNFESFPGMTFSDPLVLKLFWDEGRQAFDVVATGGFPWGRMGPTVFTYSLSVTGDANTTGTRSFEMTSHPEGTLAFSYAPAAMTQTAPSPAVLIAGAKNVRVGAYMAGYSISSVDNTMPQSFIDQIPAGYCYGYGPNPKNVVTNGTPVTIVAHDPVLGDVAIAAYVGDFKYVRYVPYQNLFRVHPQADPNYDTFDEYRYNIYAKLIPSGLDASAPLDATVYIGGIASCVWTFGGQIRIEDSPYEFPWFPVNIYTGRSGEIAGTYKPEGPWFDPVDPDWTNRTVLTYFEGWAYWAHLEEKAPGAGEAWIIIDEPVSRTAARTLPYSLTNTVLTGSVPGDFTFVNDHLTAGNGLELIADPPNHVGGSNAWVRISNAPTIEAIDGLVARTDSAGNYIGLFTLPGAAPFYQDVNLTSGSPEVTLYFYKKGAYNKENAENLPQDYVETVKGFIKTEDNGSFHIYFLNPSYQLHLAPGDYTLVVTAETFNPYTSDPFTPSLHRVLGWDDATVSPGQLTLVDGIYQNPYGDTYLGTYTPHDLADTNDLRVVITLDGKPYGGHLRGPKPDGTWDIHLDEPFPGTVTPGGHTLVVEVYNGDPSNGDLYARDEKTPFLVKVRAKYQFPWFPLNIYTGRSGEIAGTYKPEGDPLPGWTSRTGLAYFEGWAYWAHLEEKADASGEAWVIIDEPVSRAAARTLPYSLTNTVLTGSVPGDFTIVNDHITVGTGVEFILDPPNHVGGSNAWVRISNAPEIKAIPSLVPKTDAVGSYIGTFTLPQTGVFYQDAALTNGTPEVTLYFYERSAYNKENAENLPQNYVETVKGFIKTEDNGSFRIYFLNPSYQLPLDPGQYTLVVTAETFNPYTNDPFTPSLHRVLGWDNCYIANVGGVDIRDGISGSDEDANGIPIGTWTPPSDWAGDPSALDVWVIVKGKKIRGKVIGPDGNGDYTVYADPADLPPGIGGTTQDVTVIIEDKDDGSVIGKGGPTPVDFEGGSIALDGPFAATVGDTNLVIGTYTEGPFVHPDDGTPSVTVTIGGDPVPAHLEPNGDGTWTIILDGPVPDNAGVQDIIVTVTHGSDDISGTSKFDIVPEIDSGSLLITYIKVFKDSGGDKVEIHVKGCVNYTRDYMLFGHADLTQLRGTTMPFNTTGVVYSVIDLLTPRSTTALVFRPTAAEIEGGNTAGEAHFIFDKPAEGKYFWDIRELRR